MKATKVELIPTTLKLLLLGCLAITASSNSALGQGPSEPIDSIVIGGDPPPPADDDSWWDWFFDWGIKKPTVENNPIAAPTCAHGAAWGCSKCGHIPPSQGIRDLKDLGRRSPLRSRVAEVPVRRTDQLWRRSHPKTGPSGYPCSTCGKFHELGEKIPVCDRCGGMGFCNCLRSDFPY